MTFCLRGESTSAAGNVTTFHQFFALSPEQAQKNVPVRIKGVIVCYDPAWGQLYLQDGAETGYLNPQLFQTNLEAGQAVELTGSTTVTQGSVTFTNLHLEVLDHGGLPEGKHLELAKLGADFGQWIQTSGRVRVAETSSGRLCLVLHDKGQACLAYVMGLPSTNNFKGLLGCDVRVQGINASKSAGGALQASIFVPGINAVTVIERPDAKSGEVPVTSIDAMLSRELGGWTNEPVHLNGVLVSYEPGESLVLRDSTGLIHADVIQKTEALVDQRVDLWGYVTVLPGETILRDAYFEPTLLPAAVITPTAAMGFPNGQTNNRAEITRYSQIAAIRPEEAAQGFPVRLRGVITYADPDWHNCFIQSRGGAIYVETSQNDIAAGQWVEVTGQTSPGGFAPEVLNATVRTLSATNLPIPIKTDLEELADGHLDSHWVQLEGVVRGVTEQWRHETLYLTTPKGRFKAVVLKPDGQPPSVNLIDALVSVRGACTSQMNARGQLTGISLRVPDLKQIQILEAVPADPFSIPATAIRSVGTFDPIRLAGRRVKVSGCVTLVVAGQKFYVQDDSGGIQVNSFETKALQVGDRVDVLGFPAMGDFSPCLEEATFQRVGRTVLPKPQITTAEEMLLQGTNDAVLVRVKAHLIQNVPHSAHPKLVLQSGPVIFSATLTAPPADHKVKSLPVGSLLELTGVASIQGGENHEPESFRLLVSGPSDLALLGTPPWWTIQHTLMLLGGLALGTLLAWGWIHSLRRQVQAQTEVIRKKQEELMTVSRQAGRAEVATAVLHNVGNVLNSVNVSAALARDTLRESRSHKVSLTAALLKRHAGDLSNFLTQDPNGRHLPEYLDKLGEHLVEEKQTALQELNSLTKHIQHINDIVAMQQTYAKVGGLTEKIKVSELVEDTIRMNLSSLERHGIKILRAYDEAGGLEITVEKHKALQILNNLISNAKHACVESGRPEKRVAIHIVNGDGRVRIACTDNGVGISSENLTRIFNHGFTTRKTGHGFGLHSAALAAQEMGGTLRAESEGVGKGSAFTLELPRTQKRS
ncbi:MAG TPA: HAMP domain-containing sensor histidine kinase [Verrucomicrobiae bacterium]|nr:HAMP domain-containing sensor histidine kinase [Verrucomicrobiae bacterium]